MARTKSIPIKRKPGTSTMSGGRSYSTVGLNRRILAVLKSSQEQKRFSAATTFVNSVAAATDLTFYINPFVGIGQGVDRPNRIGNKIIVDKIHILMRYLPVHSLCTDQSNISADLRCSLISTEEAVFQNSAATVYTPAVPYVFSGFPALGMINDVDVNLIAYKDKHFDGGGDFVAATSAGVSANDCSVRLVKTFGKKGKSVEYRAGTNIQIPENVLIVCALDVPGRGNTALINTLRVDVSYDVFFRDS